MIKLLLSITLFSPAALTINMERPGRPVSGNIINQKLQNALVNAAGAGDLEGVQRLLKHRPHVDINAVNDFQEMTPLQAAVIHNQVAVARYLLDHGANINQRLRGGLYVGNTPLMITVRLNKPGMVELLLCYGADMKLRTFELRGMPGRRAIDMVNGTAAQRKQMEDLLMGNAPQKLR